MVDTAIQTEAAADARVEPTSPGRVGGDWAWTVTLLDVAGLVLAAVDVEPDWSVAIEWAHWRAVVESGSHPLLGDPGGSVEPVWAPGGGASVVSAVRVRSASGPDPDESEFVLAVDSPFFRELARRASAVGVERGALEAGQSYDYRIEARVGSGGLGAGASSSVSEGGLGDWGFEDVTDRLPVRTASLDARDRRAQARGRGAHGDDTRTFIGESVLAAVDEGARSAGDVEVGGVLLGYVSRDTGSGAYFVDVTAQVPARHTEATRSSLTFTAETWADVHAQARARGHDELVLGWWHLHPDFAEGACSRCPLERRRTCPLSNAFFSSTDVHMHGAVFPRAYQVALLVSDLGQAEREVGLYGWREGTVVARGFEVVPDAVMA